MLVFVNKIFILFFIFTRISLTQSDLLNQKEYADSLYLSQNYFDAIKEYKRLIFFDRENLFTYYSYSQIAKCYKYGGKFEDSYNYFSLALSVANSHKEVFDSKIEICRLNIIQKKIKNAHRILDELEKDSLFNYFINQIKFWRAWTFYFEMNFEKAHNLFDELGKKELSEQAKKLSKESYSVEKAKILSMILPGAGQFYTNNYLSGLGSFAWNLLSGYLTIKAFSNERIFDGIILSNFLWLRFYKGNLENAEKFAYQKNEELFNSSLNFLYFNFPEEIP